jgi:hypothetical protein
MHRACQAWSKATETRHLLYLIRVLVALLELYPSIPILLPGLGRYRPEIERILIPYGKLVHYIHATMPGRTVQCIL